MGKRGQIAVFVIIGLLMLLALGIVMFINARWTNRFVPDKVVPENVMPVKRYIESCIYDAAKDGLVTMGLQGGFIELPPKIRYSPTSYISLGGVQKVPLWYFRGETRMPTLDYMKQDLEEFISDRLGICAEGLGMFEQFSIQNLTPAMPEVTFGEDDVSVVVAFPLVITDKIKNKETKIRDFGSDVAVRMLKVYSLARSSFESEISSMFLENITMELMTADEEFPFTGMEFHCGTSTWEVRSLRSRLMDHIFYNLPRIRVKNTAYSPFLRPVEEYEAVKEKAGKLKDLLRQADYDGNDPLPDALKEISIGDVPDDMYEYTHLFVDVGSSLPDAVEKFIYLPSYGMDFRPKPSDGGIMTSKETKGALKYLSFLCMNFYHFTYDIVYPVEVRIVDPVSLEDEGGFLFRFGIPVTIRNNEGVKEDFGQTVFQGEPGAYEFCNILGDRTVDIEARGIFEGYTDQPINGVNLTYVCISHYCQIGSTGPVGGTFRFRGKLPSSCTNPTIIASKEGYLDAEAQLTGDELVIEMEKLRSLKVRFEKKIYRKGIGLSDEVKSLGEEDEVALYLSYLGHPHDQYLTYPSVNSTGAKLDFIEAGSSYSIEALLMKGNETVGGYINRNITISYSAIAGKDTVVITLVEYEPLPEEYEEEAEMMSYIYDGDYLPLAAPRFE